MPIKFYFPAIVLLFLLTSCATGYKPVNAPLLNYQNNSNNDGIAFSYKYDVLSEAGNRKYAKKEKKSHVKVVAVKITNNTGRTLDLSTDVEIYSNNEKVMLMDPALVRKSLRQTVPSYLLYLLLSPTTFYAGNDSDARGFPIGLILGPGLTAYNMLRSGTANQKLENELTDYNFDKKLENGKTGYALIGLKGLGYDPLTVRLR